MNEEINHLKPQSDGRVPPFFEKQIISKGKNLFNSDNTRMCNEDNKVLCDSLIGNQSDSMHQNMKRHQDGNVANGTQIEGHMTTSDDGSKLKKGNDDQISSSSTQSPNLSKENNLVNDKLDYQKVVPINVGIRTEFGQKQCRVEDELFRADEQEIDKKAIKETPEEAVLKPSIRKEGETKETSSLSHIVSTTASLQRNRSLIDGSEFEATKQSPTSSKEKQTKQSKNDDENSRGMRSSVKSKHDPYHKIQPKKSDKAKCSSEPESHVLSEIQNAKSDDSIQSISSISSRDKVNPADKKLLSKADAVKQLIKRRRRRREHKLTKDDISLSNVNGKSEKSKTITTIKEEETPVVDLKTASNKGNGNVQKERKSVNSYFSPFHQRSNGVQLLLLVVFNVIMSTRVPRHYGWPDQCECG